MKASAVSPSIAGPAQAASARAVYSAIAITTRVTRKSEEMARSRMVGPMIMRYTTASAAIASRTA